MIAINDNLNSEQLTVPNNIEAIAVSINCKKRLNFGIVYIPPNSPDSYHNSVTSFIHSLPLENNTTIVGDFNDPDINWSTLSGSNSNSSQFCDFIFDTNFVQLIETPTHVAEHILDLVLTNHNHSIQNLTLDSKLPPQLSSDHYMIKFDILCDAGPPTKAVNSNNKLNYSKTNWEGIYQFLSQYNFDPLLTFQDSESKWIFIKNVILEAVHKFTPFTRRRSHSRPRWFTPDIQHQLNCVHTTRRKARTKPTSINISKLNTAEH